VEKQAVPPDLKMEVKDSTFGKTKVLFRRSSDNVRVTIYTNTLAYRLLSPDLQLLDSGRIPVDTTHQVTLAALETGSHFLEVTPKQGSARVVVHHQCMAELATPEQPINLFNDSITRWFLVPPAVKSFRIGARDGGQSEPAHIVITSPTGRVAYDVDGNYSGVETEIRVRPEETGKLWQIHVDPVQDVSFWLDGGACPYLSTAPERVLVPAALGHSKSRPE